MSVLPAAIKAGIWDLTRDYYDIRLRVGDLPGCPPFAKPFVGKWSAKLGHVVEWACGPDKGPNPI